MGSHLGTHMLRSLLSQLQIPGMAPGEAAPLAPHGDFLRLMVQASAGANQAVHAVHSSVKSASEFW